MDQRQYGGRAPCPDPVRHLSGLSGQHHVLPCIRPGSAGEVEVHRCLQNKYDVALGGMLGYELDLPKMPEWVQQEIRQQIIHYRQIEELVKRGDLYRLVSAV